MGEGPDEFVEGLRDEMLDLPFAPDDEGQRRHLDAPDIEARLVIAVLAEGHRVRPGEVHTDEPVRPVPAEAGEVQVVEITVLPDVREGPRQRRVVLGVDEDTLDMAGITEIMENLVDEELAFPVRVAGVHDGVVGLKELPDSVELFLTGRHGEHLPVRREDRIFRPSLVAFVVLGGFCHAEDMAESPGDCRVALFVVVLGLRVPVGEQMTGNGPGDIRLFGDE